MTHQTVEPSTVLCIDNNPDDLHLLEIAVSRTRAVFQLRGLTSLPAAKAYLLGDAPFSNRTTHPLPVAMLIDYSLDNGTTGIDLLQWMRTQQNLDEITAVLFSDNEQDGSFAVAYQCGAAHCLKKPVDMEGMLVIVRALSACLSCSPRRFDSLMALPEYRARAVSADILPFQPGHH